MGQTDNAQRDSAEFSQGNPVVRQLVEHSFAYPELGETDRRELQGLMVGLVETLRNNCPSPESTLAFGWKRAIATFTCQMFLDAYPEARTVHLVRDGRDVMLSRLNARMGNLARNALNRLVVFGDASLSTYRGRPLDQAVVEEYRNEIEMHHWVTAVSFGRRARQYGERYLEIRYEDLCREPIRTLSTVFEFLDLPFNEQAREWVRQNASVQSIGKWKGREDELRDAIRIGEPLLKELGYL